MGNRTAVRFRKPRDVRQLRHMTMSDEELTTALRLRILREAVDALRTRPMTNEEWREFMLQIYYDGKDRSKNP